MSYFLFVNVHLTIGILYNNSLEVCTSCGGCTRCKFRSDTLSKQLICYFGTIDGLYDGPKDMDFH